MMALKRVGVVWHSTITVSTPKRSTQTTLTCEFLSAVQVTRLHRAMSRNSNKKPVGFATHIIAGGFAGGCEAVSYQSLRV
jgi:hypothetical protein